MSGGDLTNESAADGGPGFGGPDPDSPDVSDRDTADGTIRLPGGIGDLPSAPRRPPSGPLFPTPAPVPTVGPTSSSLPFPVAASTVEPGSIPVIAVGSAPPPPPPPPPPPVPPPPTPPPPIPSTRPSATEMAGFAAAVSSPVIAAVADPPASFVPLRTDPPPRLLATWWLRYLLLLTMVVCIAVTVMTEYALGPGGVVEAPLVIASHLLAAMLLVGWTICAMYDANRLVPASRYHRGSSCVLAALSWVAAFAAPLAFVTVFSRARPYFGDPDKDVKAVAIAVGAGVVASVFVWLPFGYLAGQAQRIGAPRRVVVLWFVGSILAAIGSVAIVMIGLGDLLDDSGMTAAERSIQTAVLYGIPAFVFALSTWRATTVFDEVIDLRWGRWRTEWEMTLLELAAQPVPGPELAAPES